MHFIPVRKQSSRSWSQRPRKPSAILPPSLRLLFVRLGFPDLLYVGEGDGEAVVGQGDGEEGVGQGNRQPGGNGRFQKFSQINSGS